MSDLPPPLSNQGPGLWAELRRRNVIRMAGLYLVGAWLIVQVAETVLPVFGVPDWVLRALIILLALGFLPALVFSWIYELTPEGLKRDAEVDPARSIASQTANRMDQLTLAGVVILLAVIAADRYWPQERVAPTTPVAAGLAVADQAADVHPAAAGTEKPALVQKSIAVLPFADMTETGDQAWFVDGLAEEILNALARLPELKVTARTSSFQFREPDRDIRVIAGTLGVAHVLEGSVRRIGDRLRITAQLIRAEDGFHLWSDSYDRTSDDLFEVQREVAENVAATLDVLLDGPKRERMFASGTRNVRAFEQFLKGREMFFNAHAATPGATLVAANRFFERAKALDPGYGKAAVFHSDLYAHLVMDGPNAGDVMIGAVETTQQAAIEQLRTDLDFALAHAPDAMARAVAELNREYFSPTWHRIPALLEEIRAVADLEPTVTDGGLWLHEILNLAGEADAARRVAELRLRSDPLLPAGWSDLAAVEIHAGNFDAALALIAEGRRRAGDHRWLRELELLILRLRGDRDGLSAMLEARSQEQPWLPAYLAAVRGERSTALRLASELEASDDWPSDRLLDVYHELGKTERARALAQRVDALPAGPAILGRLMVNNGGSLVFDPADTPNFRARLAEAGIDPSRFSTMPRLGENGSTPP